MADHSICLHHDLHDIATARTTHANAPAVGEFCNSLVVEREFIDAVGAVEEGDAGCRPQIAIGRAASNNKHFHTIIRT